MGQLKSKTGPSREDVAFLLRNTRFSEQAIIGWHKLFRKNSTSGFLSQTQFLALYTKFFPKGEARDYVSHVFCAYGKSKNGVGEWHLGFREYVLAIHETKSGSEEARLKRAFLMFDVEKRGGIEEKDVAAVYKSTRAMLSQGVVDPEEKAKQLFLRLDPLGQGGGVSETQFVEALLLLQQEEPGKQPRGPARRKRTSNRLKKAKTDLKVPERS